MQVTASIFKAYDIRGIVPSTLHEQVAEGLGRAFGSAAMAEGQTTVAVGRDGRLSGPALSAALIRGLVAAGVRVIELGGIGPGPHAAMMLADLGADVVRVRRPDPGELRLDEFGLGFGRGNRGAQLSRCRLGLPVAR